MIFIYTVLVYVTLFLLLTSPIWFFALLPAIWRQQHGYRIRDGFCRNPRNHYLAYRRSHPAYCRLHPR